MKRLAQEGKIEAAAAEFEKALKLDRELNFDPRAEAEKLAAQVFVSKGDDLAGQGEMEAAIAEFEKAMELDDTLYIKPETRAVRLAAERLVSHGEELAREGDIEASAAAFGKAELLGLEIPASARNTLCRFGSLHGHAFWVVNDACAKAAESAETEDELAVCRDSRGLARALNGDKQGAIMDFRFVAEKSNDVTISTLRWKWVRLLEQGKDPFTEETLEELRDE